MNTPKGFDATGKPLHPGDHVLFPTGSGYILAGVISKPNKHNQVRVLHIYLSRTFYKGEKIEGIKIKKQWKDSNILIKLDDFYNSSLICIENNSVKDLMNDFNSLIEADIGERGPCSL
jgi:hypothetical protein